LLLDFDSICVQVNVHPHISAISNNLQQSSWFYEL